MFFGNGSPLYVSSSPNPISLLSPSVHCSTLLLASLNPLLLSMHLPFLKLHPIRSKDSSPFLRVTVGPFLGTCVGQDNQRHFILFLVFVSLGDFYATCLSVIPFLSCVLELDSFALNDAELCSMVGRYRCILSSLFLSSLSPLPSPLSPLSPLFSLLFPLFYYSVTIITDIVSCTIILLIPLFIITMWQLFVVYTNTTTIESMKKAWSTPIHLWPLQYWRDFKKGNSCNFSVFRGKRFGALLL